MENKTYYDWLFNESEEEKAINAQIDNEIEAFENTAEYIMHKERLNSLWHKLGEAQNKRRAEAKKHRPRREPVKFHSDEEWAEIKKKNIEEHEKKVQALPDNIKNAILAYRGLNDEEKKKFAQMSYHDSPLKDERIDNYSDPKTNIEDIRQLQEILVQTTIDFINERGLTDIDAVYFGADGLEASAKHGEWTCSTDTSITVEGLEEEEGVNGSIYMVRRMIGHNIA